MMKKALILLLAALMMLSVIAASAEAAGEWTCENGHGGNIGNFCGECGVPRPIIETWTCENGHGGNTGNFCGECGAPRPAETWTCENGHEGNTGNFCGECGSPRTMARSASTSYEEDYDNPFPAEIYRFTTPFEGTVVDHGLAIDEFLSHASPADDFYVEYDTSGITSAGLAWDRYVGYLNDLYIIYWPDSGDVCAYAYACDIDAAQRADWAAGALFPNTTTAVGSVLWVESGENNAVYSSLMQAASTSSDYDGVKRLIRSLDPDDSAAWLGHRVTVFREEFDDVDRYWVVYHNTET